MANNPYSETGQAEDLIRSLVQFGCAEIHAKGLYEKTLGGLENGTVDVEDPEVLQAELDKCAMYIEDIETYANLRRSVTRYLFELFENGDRDMWCMVKHLGIGAMTLFEAYEASEQDPELLSLAIEANKAFVKAISRFIGAEITDCAACLSDFFKGEGATNNG